MKTIWKFPFEISDSVAIDMPRDSVILSVECQGNEPCIWAMVDPKAESVTRLFLVYGTGHPIDGVSVMRHVATFQQNHFVWHMFE